MMRLLFCTAAILPIGLIPWMTSGSDQIEVDVEPTTYSELVMDPNIQALSDCETGELPIFFREGLVTSHSAEFIAEGLEAVEACDDVEVTIVPILPESASVKDFTVSAERTSELTAYVEAAADITDVNVDVDIADEVVQEDVSTLYINGRAAILHIESDDSGDGDD